MRPRVVSGPYAGQPFYPVQWEKWPGILTATLPGWQTVFLLDEYGNEIVRDVRTKDLPEINQGVIHDHTLDSPTDQTGCTGISSLRTAGGSGQKARPDMEGQMAVAVVLDPFDGQSAVRRHTSAATGSEGHGGERGKRTGDQRRVLSARTG